MSKNAKKDASPQSNPRASRFSSEVMGIFCLCVTTLLFLSVISYDARDPSINHVVRGGAPIQNWTGMFGSYLSAFLVDFFGFAAYTPCLFAAALTIKYLRKLPPWPWWRWAAFILLGLCLAVAGAAWQVGLADVRGGGFAGQVLHDLSVRYFSKIGSTVIWVSLFLLAVQSIGGFSWRQVGASLARRIKDSLDEASKRSRLAREVAESAKKAAGEAIDGQNGASTPVFAESGFKNESRREPELVWPGSDLGQSGNKTQPVKGGKPPFISISSSNEPVTRADSDGKKGFLKRVGGIISVSSENAAGYAPDPSSSETPPWLDDLEHGRIGAAAPQAAASPVQPATRTASAKPEAAKPEEGGLNGVIIDEQYEAPKAPAVKPRRAPAKLPGLDILRPADNASRKVSRQELEAKGRTLMTVLSDFSIQAELVRITPGPVVTSFELRPAPGVKSSRISGLSDDIALGLKAIAVRIQAPIPGTDTVGIEIPNTAREMVGLRELLAAREFQSAESLLTLALGKDISGVPTVADLARMPHMLVAGATGTGKSVFLNSVLMSVLYKARPEEVKLLLVDPKRIELAVYADLPHLVHPIVTDMTLAKNALDWAVAEMERRYNDIARMGVRNILAYNDKLKEMGAKRPPDLADLETMPYLVLIIDELADLMLTAGKDVETSIVRLAQLARAAGIHLIIATQRPSVDVVTGLIKANFPCRISFQVTSKHDSRTILDTVGAEHLLGRGDMLFKPAGGRFQRLHGAFVSDEEVAAVADYWRKQQPPDYQVDFADFGSDAAEGGMTGGGASFSSEDQKYAEAVEFVRQQGKASISLIQRRFRIGFNGAARIIEQMEKDGIIGPPDGSKPRIVR